MPEIPLTESELEQLLAQDLTVQIQELKAYTWNCEACEVESTYTFAEADLSAMLTFIRMHKQGQNHRIALAQRGLKSPIDDRRIN